MINKIPEVIDNLERSIASPKNYRHDPFFDGILSIYRQLISVLREYRVERIAEFDPNIHEAV